MVDRYKIHADLHGGKYLSASVAMGKGVPDSEPGLGVRVGEVPMIGAAVSLVVMCANGSMAACLDEEQLRWLQKELRQAREGLARLRAGQPSGSVQ